MLLDYVFEIFDLLDLGVFDLGVVPLDADRCYLCRRIDMEQIRAEINLLGPVRNKRLFKSAQTMPGTN